MEQNNYSGILEEASSNNGIFWLLENTCQGWRFILYYKVETLPKLVAIDPDGAEAGWMELDEDGYTGLDAAGVFNDDTLAFIPDEFWDKFPTCEAFKTLIASANEKYSAFWQAR